MPATLIASFAVAAAAVASASIPASAFTFVAPPSMRGTHHSRNQILYMSDDQPSDSSSEDLYDTSGTIDVAAEEYEPTETENLVTSVLDELPPDLTSLDVSKETQASINEALIKLEALNPTKNPTTSPLLNGVWSLRYAGGYSSEWALPSPTRQVALFLYSGGYSPGLFALSLAQKLPSQLVELGDLEISISREQPRVEAKIDAKMFGGSDNEIVVKARLDVDSDVRLTETYESASVLGQTVDLPASLQYSRDLYVTYVDEDILVVRDATGVPEVLVRKEKTFVENWGMEPGDDELTAPGEEDLPATD